jgi:NADH-quinone oxidoreductase subunit L
MTLPLVVLAFFAVTAGWVGIPEHFPGLGGLLPNWFEEFVGTGVLTEHAEAESFSQVPLITSLVVALGGLWLGWLVYKGVAARKDPLEKPLGFLYPILKNKYYLDEIYAAILYKPAGWLAETFSYLWLDKGLIDGILHLIGRIGVWIGGLVRNWIDLPLINGAGDATARGTRGLGGFLRDRQGGRVQTYMAIAVGFAVLGGLLYYFLVFLS